MSKGKIEGLDEVTKRMRALSDGRRQKNAATRSARKAMAIVRKAAIANAKAIDDPVTAERIWKNIATTSAKTRQNYVLMRVGVRGGARSYANTKANVRKGRAGKTYATNGSKNNAGGDTWYWRFVELGTARTRAKPFMRPALNNNVQNVESEFVTDYKAQLDKELAK